MSQWRMRDGNGVGSDENSLGSLTGYCPLARPHGPMNKLQGERDLKKLNKKLNQKKRL